MAFIKLLICFLLFGTAVKAQTFAEWFDQKNTQKKYLAQQIVALQAYESVLATGYKVAHGGLGSITSSTRAEMNLHSSYYGSLKAVSPAVKNNPQVKEILVWQQNIIAVLNSLGNDSYYQQVKTAVLADCDKQLKELQRIVSDSQGEMSDAERLKAIGRVHTAMQDNYRFSISFCNHTKILLMQKVHEGNDAATLRQYYGNH